MSPRTVKFVPDGVRQKIAPETLVEMWRRHTWIDVRYALGTAQHETDFTTNEQDVEESGFVSLGLYQISHEEMVHVGMYDADPFDAEECTIIFAMLTAQRYNAIADAVGRGIGWSNQQIDDVRAYLSIAHNQGLSACLKTIRMHGLGWKAYKQRNLEQASAAVAAARTPEALAQAQEKLQWWRKAFEYGDDCVSGGAAARDVA